MAKKWKPLVCSSAIVLVAWTWGCRSGRNDIKIGWIGPLTGDAAPYGQSIKKGTDLAVEGINAQGGVGGKKLRVVYEDDQATARLGTAAMEKLLAVDKPSVIIQAAASSVMIANIPVAERNKVVYISPSCSSDEIRAEKVRLNAKYIFRTWPSDSYQGQVIAHFVFERLGARRSAVLYINNDYGVGLKEAFVNEFRALGGEVVADESFDQGATDFRSQLVRIKQSGPGVVFLSSHYVEAASVLRQAKQLGLKAQFVADAALFSPEILKLAGTAAEGLIVTNPEWDPQSKQSGVRTFVTEFQHAYHDTPDVYAASGYDLTRLLAQAMREKGLSSEQIRQGLLGLKGFQGVTGRIVFDEFGEVQGHYTVYQVRDGAFVPFG